MPPLRPVPRSAPYYDLVIVGNVTVDLVDGKRALGGAVSYAAAVAAAAGVRACVVTAKGPPDAGIDAALAALFQVWSRCTATPDAQLA